MRLDEEFLTNDSGNSPVVPALSVIEAPLFARLSYLTDSYRCALFFGRQKSTFR